MPFALALLASALIHVAALVAPGWVLPGTHDTDPPLIATVVTKPAPRPETPSAARPTPKPPVDRPRPQPSHAPAVEAPAPVAEAPAPPVVAPVETPPIAVPPAPTFVPPAPQPVSIGLPGKGRVRYVITRGEGGFIVGQAVHSWEHDGFTYKLKSMTETTGLAAVFKPAQVFQSSQGEVTAEGLRPRDFRHERAGGSDTASFDWARGIVAYAGREDAIAAGTQDMLSMYYQLVLLAPTTGAVEIPIATGRKVEVFRFEVIGEEAVTLPSGERRAVHLKARSGNDTMELWIAAQRRGLPLKIRITDRRGDIFDQLADDTDPRETQ